MQPIIGEQFADSFIRPLSLAELMPLIQSGCPVDILFRLGVQSVNGLQNARALGGSENQGSPLFFLLLHDLRVLQIAGLLDVAQRSGKSELEKNAKTEEKLYLEIGPTADPNLAATAAEARALLGMAPDALGAEVVYGVRTGAVSQISILTRPMLGILNQLAIQVDVPPADIVDGQTTRSVGNIGIEHRPVVVVQSGREAPSDAFVAIHYHQTWFWISGASYQSRRVEASYWPSLSPLTRLPAVITGANSQFSRSFPAEMADASEL